MRHGGIERGAADQMKAVELEQPLKIEQLIAPTPPNNGLHGDAPPAARA